MTGSKLVKRSIMGLMDQADLSLQKHITEVIDKETRTRHIAFNNLRHRQSGNKVFIEFYLLLPQDIKLVEAHRDS